MREKRVKDILIPFMEDIPLRPSVTPSDKIVLAIELMVNKNLKCIAVIEKHRPVGMVRLEDALDEMGLHVSDK